MSPDKPKTLTIKKPLTLAQQARMLTSIAKGITPPLKPHVQTKPLNKKSASPQEVAQNQKDQKRSTDKEVANKGTLDKIAQREFQKQRQARYKQALNWLCQNYPACFDHQDPKPLKIGMIKDVLQAMAPTPNSDQPSHVSIRHAIAYYTRSRLYHQAILSKSHRCDLIGQQSQEITTPDREHARAQLESKDLLQQKWQEKKNKPHKTNVDQSSDSPIESSP